MNNNNNLALVFIGVPTLFYIAQSCQYLIQQGRYGMALAFFSYALANVGLILDSKGI